MIKVKVVTVTLGEQKITDRLEEALKNIHPSQLLYITQNNVVGYTIFYDDEADDDEES